MKKGGSYDPYRQPIEYPFPCMKLVGQIILGADALAGADASLVTQSCANGVVKLQVEKDGAKASLQYVLGMTINIYAIRGQFEGIREPVWLRLYRHRDTAHMSYMSADGKTYTRPEAEPDKVFNGPIDHPPVGKVDGISGFARKCQQRRPFREGLNMY